MQRGNIDLFARPIRYPRKEKACARCGAPMNRDPRARYCISCKDVIDGAPAEPSLDSVRN